MSVVVRARLLGHVTKEEIMSYIYDNWDKNVKDFVQYDNYNNWKEESENLDWIKEMYDDDIYVERGFILFEYNKEQRTIFYNYASYNSYENLEYYYQYGLEDMVKSETTYLSLNKWGSAIEIMEKLVLYFGGYIDYNDNDEDSYNYIPAQKDNKNKLPIFYMTQEELNEHFGGIVVIKNKK